jgi:autotransporter-associated beta strand repeat/autotransporter-associated beta strand repeat/autotransporter-associated beta strand repeat/autotransporter-associated beta strand repeat/autotransporter-associated beta strand repeat/autotransporter-associated beta strand repeat
MVTMNSLCTKIVSLSIALAALINNPLHSTTTLNVTLGTDANATGFGNPGDLRYAINSANTIFDSNFIITFSVPTVTITGMLPPLNLNGTNTITMGNAGGSPTVLEGSSLYPGFIVRQGNVTIQNMTIQNTLSQGGTGLSGGGALGAGAGLFLAGGTTTISDLTFINNDAIGGASLNTTTSGGGGMFKGNTPGYGGGGMGGLGATASSGGGGGGIGLARGGVDTVGQGGYGNFPGQPGVNGIGFGAASGGSAIGVGTGGLNAGGGGGGSPSPNIEGGGGGGDGGQNATGAQGGKGGFGGGGGTGGSSSALIGGAGGFGGGGSGADFPGSSCGPGGFGGGGGGGGIGFNTPAGIGGFGAGGGISQANIATGGVGGGNGTTNARTGGAGLGGAIFVNVADSAAASSYYNGNPGSPAPGNASLVIAGPVTMDLGSPPTATGTNGGASVGPHIFGTTGQNAVVFNIASGTTPYAGTIFDDSLNCIPSGNTWVPGSLAGAQVVKQGNGTIALSGTSKYSGGTFLQGGTIQALSTNCMGNTASPLTFQGTGTRTLQAGTNLTLAYPMVLPSSSQNTFDTNSFNLTLSGALTGTGALTQIDSSSFGDLILTNGSNSIAGGANILDGTLILSGAGVLSASPVPVFVLTQFSIQPSLAPVTIGDLTGSGSVQLGAQNLTVGTSNSTLFSGTISGSTGQFTKQGTGILTLTGSYTSAGPVNVKGGILRVDTSTLVPTGGIVTTNPGIIEFNQISTGTYSGNISGTGALIAAGGGTINLTGTNSYSNGTTIQPATTLYGPTSAIQGNIANSGIVDFERAVGSSTYSGIISGIGTTKINAIGLGTGTVNFSNVQAYTNNTIVAAGTLGLTGLGDISSAAQLQIDSGANFDISGIAAASTTVGQLIGSGTINVGTKTLITNTTTTPVTFGGSITGSGGFTKAGPGKLILTGTSPLFSGTATVSGGTLQIAPNTFVANIVNNSNLDFEQSSGTGIYPGNISGTGTVTINSGGIGSTGTVEFTGLSTYAGTTTVTLGNLIINQSASNTLPSPFVTNAGTSVDFDQAATTTGTYSGNISGGGDVAINQLGNTGTVILSGIRSNLGTTHVYFGTLELLNSTTSTITSGLIVDAGANVDFEQVAPTTGTYTGGITGGGNVLVNNAGNTGNVVLAGINTYTGTTTVANGTLEIFNNTTTTFVSAMTVNAGAILDLEQAANSTGTFSGGLSGAGTLYINAASSTGTVYLTGPVATFTGPTTVFNGVLAGTPTSLPAVQPILVNSGATVDIEQAIGSATFSGSIQDNGAGQHGAVAINKLGGLGTIVLSNTNSYTGGTTVYNGTLQGDVLSLVGNIAVNTGASVDIEQVIGSGTFTGTITDNGSNQHGSVSINKQGGTGTVVYTSAQSYTGGTSIFNGTLETQPAFLTGNIAVSSGASLDIEQPSSTGTFTGNITGNGSVVINSVGGNIGTVILSGNNSYSGGTIVDGGTLQGNTNSLFGVITDNATVTFSQSFDGIFNGSFTGPGIINIQGGGLVRFDSNSSTFSGTTNVDHGRLSLNSTLGGNVNVKALGIFSGTGTFLGNVTVEAAGTIRPGNSIGTLHIGGNYIQKAGSIYDVQVTQSGQNSLLDITGTANLDPGSILHVTALNGVPAVNTIYTILKATGGVNGTYSTVLIDNPLIVTDVTYDAQHVYLDLMVNFPLIALTYNQKQVANQLATLGVNPSPELQLVLEQLISGTAAEASSSLSQMSAVQYTNVVMTAELANRQFIRRLFDPLRSIIITNPCKQSVECCYVQPFDVWASMSGGRTFISGNKNAPGFRIADYEISCGAQTTFRKCWTIGVAVSYEKDTLGYKVGGSGTCNTVLGAAYGLFRGKRFYALTDITVGYSQDKVRRTINVGSATYKPRGNPKAYTQSIYAELGTDFAINNTLIQPFIGLEWGHYNFNKISESGGSPLNVIIFSKAKSNVYSRLGLHMSSPPLRCGFSMGLDLAWIFRLSSLGNNITVQFKDFGSKFNIQGLPLNRNSYEGIVHFNQIIYKSWEAYFEASCQGWEGSTAYSFIGGIKTSW